LTVNQTPTADYFRFARHPPEDAQQARDFPHGG
jgi:hypothetical protein